MATLTPQFLQRFHNEKEKFKKSVCCQVDILFATFLDELKTGFLSCSGGDDSRAHFGPPMMNGSSQNTQSSHLHYHLGQPDHKQRSVAKGENSHFHLQNFSTTINKTHQQPMLRTHRVTSRSQHPSGQQKTSMQSIISAHFINREFKDDDDVEDFESYEDEEEEEEEEEEDDGLGHGFMLKGGIEGDEESEEDLSSENDLPNLRVDQVNGFSSIVNKRLKTEHCKNDGDAEEAETNNNENEEDKEKEEKTQKKDDDDDPSEEMVVHVAPDEAILNAGSRESPPVMLIPQNRMPSPLRIGDRLACPLTGCDRSYRQMKQYISHMWTHRGIKPYRCTWADGPNECHQCQYMSEHPRNVIQHVRLTHFGIPRTIKEQRALGIVDDRDPATFMELRTDLDLG